jgi:hypothetical protein
VKRRRSCLADSAGSNIAATIRPVYRHADGLRPDGNPPRGRQTQQSTPSARGIAADRHNRHRAYAMGYARAVAARNSERVEKSRVFGWAAVVSPACPSSSIHRLGSCSPIPQSGRSGTGEPRPPSPAARFFVAGDQVGLHCSRSTVCSGSGSTDYGRAVWTRWCWSNRQRSFNGTVRASASFDAGARDPDDHCIEKFVN